MANIVGRLKATLRLDKSRYEKGMKNARRRSSKVLSGLKSQALKVGGAIAGAFALKGIVRSINQTAKFGDEMAKLSKQTGFAVETIQKYRFAAERSGVSSQKLNTILQVFQKRLGELKAGTGSLHTRLKKLDPQFMKQLKATNDTNEAFRMYVNRVSQVSDKSTQAAFAQAAFSRTGIEMTRMMQGGTQELDKLGQKAEETGGIISGKTAAASEDYVDKLTDMKMAMTGVKTVLLETFMPLFKDLIDRFKNLAKWLKENRESITKWVKIIGSAVGVLGTVRIAMIAFNAVLAANPIGLVITALAGLVAAFRAAWKNSETFRNFFKKLWIRIKQYSTAAWDAVKTYFGSIGTVLRTIGKAIGQVFKGQFKKAKDTIKSGFKNLVSDFATIGKDAKEKAQKELKELETDPVDKNKAAEAAKDIGEEVGKSYADGVKDGIKKPGAISTKDMLGPIVSASEARKETDFDISMGGLIPDDAGMKIQKTKDNLKDYSNMIIKAQNDTSLLGSISKKAFQGMSNSLQEALSNGKNILDSFGKFFIDMLKSLIIKLAAAAAAAFALSLLLGGTGLMKVGGSALKGLGKGGFGQAFKALGGFGMQEGGIVPSGFPNDSFPARLTSGEVVLNQKQLRNLGRQQRGYIAKTEISMRKLKIGLEEEGKSSERFE
ncbi:MAG: hypothetical protein K9J21_07365 [Bacteroidales bacterium]|nr:hypothetical protein [Bacteroidales bacterium]